jgi:hypothetical protein
LVYSASLFPTYTDENAEERSSSAAAEKVAYFHPALII